jgi:hypothetical protein
MIENQQTQIQAFLWQLDALIRRGRELRAQLLNDPASISAIAATRVWHEHCGVLINQLSGGSKAHWLARSFSEAFLMRSASGHAVEAVAPEQIVQRLLEVLERAVSSLSRTDDRPVLATSAEPPPRRFDFVNNADLRPVIEEAYTESKRTLERGDYDLALRTSCGILEAIITDALEHKGLRALAAVGAPAGPMADWTFDTRIEIAEKTGLIRGGCARLPALARAYRDESPNQETITERDAQRAAQVLHVIMRDLNPGR